MNNIRQIIDDISSITELLQGNFKQEDYGKVVLSMTILRRFDCIHCAANGSKINLHERLYNSTSMAEGVRKYTKNFPETTRYILKYFDFETQIAQMERNDLLYLAVERFSRINLYPDELSNVEMAFIFKELVRLHSMDLESDGYTHDEVIALMVNALFLDNQKLIEDIHRLEKRILANLIKVMEVS